MDVSIITVNFRSKDHLERMVASILKHTQNVGFEVIVVNNDPDEDVGTDSELVKIIDNERNVGFAAACNQGIKISKGRYVVLMNPDVELTDNSLSSLVKHLDQDEEVGIAGPRLFYPDGNPQPSVRRFPKPWDQLLILLKVPHILTNLGAINYYLHTDLDTQKTQDVDQVMGAYFMIRRETLDELGPLDEGFFYWYEEVDYCLRSKKAGWKVRYYADVSAKHYQAGSFSRESTIKKQSVIRRSLRRYIRKHFSLKHYLIFVSLDPLFRLLAVIAHAIKRK